jgi:hypothetical protein
MTDHETITADGVVVVYNRPAAPWLKDASTVREYLHAFSHHSRHPVWEVNTDCGFPAGLPALEFRATILHYSVFAMGPYSLDDTWLAYLDQSKRPAAVADVGRAPLERHREPPSLHDLFGDPRLDAEHAAENTGEHRRAGPARTRVS